MEKKLSLIANVAIIVVAFAAVVLMTRNEIIARQIASAAKAQRQDPSALIGKQFPVAESWNTKKQTVVLALSVGCRYCASSAQFYKELISYAAQHQTNIIALLPQAQADAVKYINQLGLDIPIIQQVEFRNIHVGGTPTLFVIDDKGVVEKVWQGQLQEDEQKKVLSAIT